MHLERTIQAGEEPEDHKKGIQKFSKMQEEKLERPMAPAMPCKENGEATLKCQATLSKESKIGSDKEFRTMYACMVESHQSTRQRAESLQSKSHEYRIAGEGFTSMNRHNLVHKFIPMPQAMKIPDAKSASHKEWKKLKTIHAWNLEKIKGTKEVVLDAQRDKKESPLCFTDGHTGCFVG